MQALAALLPAPQLHIRAGELWLRSSQLPGTQRHAAPSGRLLSCLGRDKWLGASMTMQAGRLLPFWGILDVHLHLGVQQLSQMCWGEPLPQPPDIIRAVLTACPQSSCTRQRENRFAASCLVRNCCVASIIICKITKSCSGKSCFRSEHGPFAVLLPS